jgi:hypothetical protein
MLWPLGGNFMNQIGGNIYEGIKPSGAETIQGWNSNNPAFRELIEKKRPKVIIEVGTWLGASAINMAAICKELGLGTKIYCVDTWLGAEEFWTSMAGTQERDLKQRNGYPTVYWDFLANVVEHGHKETIVPIPNTSRIGSLILQKNGILADLVYIDGSHLYEDVKADIASYKTLLAPEGVMFGDDIDWPSVRAAVSESFANQHECRGPFWVSFDSRQGT